MSTIPNSPSNRITNFETMMQRKQTQLQINLYGTEVQIIRNAPKVLTNAGGVARASSTPTTFPPVKRLFGYEGHETQEAEPNMGIGKRYRRYIIGTFNDDLQRGDTFLDPASGLMMQIQFVNEDRSTETKANIEPIN